jgi:DNA gyrase/topoisomerase IV subunit B
MNQALVEDVVTEVMRRLSSGNGAGATGRAARREALIHEKSTHDPHLPDGQFGIFASVDQAVSAATEAFTKLSLLSIEDRDQIVKHQGRGANGRATPEITRFKGPGEMMPKVLWETTLNPKTRRLLRVEISDQIVTDRVINELMGKDPSARFRFIMDRAEQAEELDV